MAEAVVSVILEKLIGLTVDKASETWSLVRGVEKEVKSLERKFKALQFMLEDAEEKQHLDKRVKHWLDRFKDVADDMEDLLDEWRIAVQALPTDEAESSSSSSVRKLKLPFLSCFSSGTQLVRRHDIAVRIKQINEELDEIVKDKDMFKLEEKETKQVNFRRPETTSFVDVSDLKGRDDEKEDIIWRILLGEENSPNIPTITIVGIGGIGKTSLAQLIYNDRRIQTHFSKTIWVFVSDPFDQSHIARAILGDLDPHSLRSLTTPTLQSLLSKIREKLAGTKFLLVFDDVWTDDDQDWEPLKATFKYGMSGSWILVTTRKELVARQMESTHVVHLSSLPDDMCWSILAQKALRGRNQVSHENVEDIGRQIAKKCGGSPLAAKTLGDLLQDKRGREEWQSVLNSVLWKSGFAHKIFSPLLLSYYDLPSPIRQCLLYCSIFPKGHRIDKYELIQCWMAQDYLNSDDNVGRELHGEDYFRCLATRSFFQNLERDAYGGIISCKMHDMVREFVLFLTEHRVVTKTVVENLTSDSPSKKARHLRLVNLDCSSSPLSIDGIEKLRSLVLVDGDERIVDDLQDLFSRSKLLRFLEFSCFLPYVSEVFGSGMKKLINLRYLSFTSCYDLENLPESLCELLNLESLNIRHCWFLKTLPVEIEKLINLKYLRIKDCSDLAYFPKGISKLTSLVTLCGIKMRVDQSDDDKFSIGDLENLDLLGGNLCIELIGDAVDCDEAKRAKLHNKIHLDRLDIRIRSPNIKKEEVLQSLNPPSKLLVSVMDFQKMSDKLSNGELERRVDLLIRRFNKNFHKYQKTRLCRDIVNRER